MANTANLVRSMLATGPNLTNFARTFERKMSDAYLGPQYRANEGAILVQDRTAGLVEERVRVSTGVAADDTYFVGFATSILFNVSEIPVVEKFTLGPDNPTATLAYENVLNVLVYKTSDRSLIPAGDPATTNPSYSRAASVLTFHAGLADTEIEVNYTFAPTAVQALTLGYQPPMSYDNVESTLQQISIGAGSGSPVFTAWYNPTETMWAIGATVYSGAGGKATLANTSNLAIGAVIQVPTLNNPYLGIRLT